MLHEARTTGVADKGDVRIARQAKPAKLGIPLRMAMFLSEECVFLRWLRKAGLVPQKSIQNCSHHAL